MRMNCTLDEYRVAARRVNGTAASVRLTNLDNQATLPE